MPEPAAIGVRTGQAERLERDARAESRRCPGGRKGRYQMDEKLGRREFLGAVGALAPVVQGVLSAQSAAAAETPAKTTPYQKVAIEPFDYSGVSLRPSFWQRQATAGRDFYLGVSNDDILHGYRVAAGTADAPGRALGGWCSPNSNTVFGQWLQSMARMQRAYGDKDLLEKANTLVSEYAKCWPGMSRGAARDIPGQHLAYSLTSVLAFSSRSLSPYARCMRAIDCSHCPNTVFEFGLHQPPSARPGASAVPAATRSPCRMSSFDTPR